MALLEVGKPFVEGRANWPEGCEYNFYRKGHDLRIFLNDPSEEEVKSVEKGRAELALLVEGDLIILLYQFEPGLPWSEAPYSWHMVAEPLRGLPELDWSVETCALLRVVLVDANSGILRALRIIKFTPAFTQALHNAITQQSLRRWPGEALFDQQINHLFQQFSTEALLQRAIARMEALKEDYDQ
jgi:hypothetical protein